MELVLQMNTIVALVLHIKSLTTRGGNNQWLGEKVSASLSERYELSEAHLTANGDGEQGEVGVNYGVLQYLKQNEKHEVYSQLQY